MTSVVLRWSLLSAALSLGCGGARNDATTAEVPRPTGDQSVFAGVAITIHAWEAEAPDYDDLAARESGPPPLRPHLSVHVTVNGGSSEGRVPGLVVLADGAPIDEVGSAAWPQSFSYQYSPRSPEPSARTVIELRLNGASFGLATIPIDAVITSPAAGETFSPARDVEVRWTGAAPSSLSVHANHHEKLTTSACAVVYKRVGEGAIFQPQPSEGGKSPPCTGEATASWTSEASLPGPFRSLMLVQEAQRTRRFDVR